MNIGSFIPCYVDQFYTGAANQPALKHLPDELYLRHDYISNQFPLD